MKLLLVLFLFLPRADSLSLEICLMAAERAFPGLAEQRAHREIADLNIRNLGSRFLPIFVLRGTGTYQSEVPEIPIAVPGIDIPTVSRDQYKAAFAVEQLVFDGGAVSAQRQVDNLQRQLSESHVEVDLHALKGQIQEAFFVALLSDAALESLYTLRADLDARLDVIEAGVRQGIVTAATADVLKVELLNLGQREAEIRTARHSAIAALAELTKLPLDPEVPLALPVPRPLEPEGDIHRPELDVFARSKDLLEGQSSLAAVPFRPRLSGFAEAAYGRPPGMNIFKDDFRFFYAAGISFNWSLWDWKQVQRKREVIRLEQDIVDTRRERFLQRIRIESKRTQEEIERLEEQLESDTEIITLRKRISELAASRLENGVITATEYLIERNAEEQAVLQRQTHRLEWIFSQVRLNQILGIS